MDNSRTCGCSGGIPDAEQDRQYAAKLVCGTIPPADRSGPLSPGQYFTAVNVHNPSRCETVQFRWKVAVGNQVSNREHPVSAFAAASLGPDEALEIDCDDAMALLGRSIKVPPFVKGWVILETEGELDVVAVYSSGPKVNAPADTFHTERVPARCVPRCQDLAIDVSTGVAAWQIRRSTDSNFVTATLGNGGNPWADLPGAIWIRPAAPSNNTDYIYQLCFDLCTGFENPTLELSLMADNSARAELNGQVLNGPNYVPSGSGQYLWHTPASTNAFKSPVTVTATPAMFRPGRNCLSIIVNNAGGPTGLAIHGFLEVERGRCPGSGDLRLPCPGVTYRAHTADHLFENDHGWLGWVSNGQTAGTTGQNRRMEALEVALVSPPPGMSIRYRAHLKNSGWTNWTPEGQTCGTTGQGRRMEAVQIELINKPLHCRVRYRVHMRGHGWSSWVNEGEEAGTTGQNRRIEAIEIVIE